MKISITKYSYKIIIAFGVLFVGYAYGDTSGNSVIDLTAEIDKPSLHEKLKNVSRVSGTELVIIYSSGPIKLKNLGDEMSVRIAENKKRYYCSSYFVEHANWFYKGNKIAANPPVSNIEEQCQS